MVQSLNKIFIFLFFTASLDVFSQSNADNVFRPKEYKDSKQFENFYKRRNAISKWQINQLKNGALVVRLQTNKTLIEGLRKMGKADLATQKEQEIMAFNKNMVMAFTRYYNFSKVYFFFSTNSDTLLKGARSGIFLDTNLIVNPEIEMKESFYLLAERDDVYNSSIGFIREDTAKFVKENGNASKDASLVIKNKYGHQLKDPFPFFVTNKSTITGTPVVNVMIGGVIIPVTVEKKNRLERHYAYVSSLNKYFIKFHSEYTNYEVNDPEIKPFLY